MVARPTTLHPQPIRSSMQFPESRPEPVDPTLRHPLSRRHLLRGLVAMAFGGAMAPMDSVAAAVSGTASINAFLEEYARFLSKQRLRHITVEQVIGAHLKCRGPVKNTPPPRSLWRNIVPTLRVADRLVRELDVPLVEIISAYRSKSYNARCPGACRDSMHTRNLALDLRYAASPRRVADAAAALRAKGLFEGGIGRYGSFTHVDTRGTNVDWRGH